MRKIFLIVVAMCFILCGCNPEQTQSAISEINKTELNLTVGQSERLTVSNANNVEWSSSDPKVARVVYGAVTAVSEGEAIISAKTVDKTFECKVVVRKEETSTETQNQNTSSSQPTSSTSSQTVTSNEQDDTTGDNTTSEKTHSEKVEATQKTAFELVERLTDEKYDKAINDLTKECNDIIDGYKKDLADTETKLENAEKGSGEEFWLKESIKQLNISIADTEKILKEGIESLERQRTQEHKKNAEDFGID